MSTNHEFAIPLLQQSFIEFGVTLVACITVSSLALVYFRRVRQERPPVGTFNGRDIATLLLLIVALPFLYAVLPTWALTCFLTLHDTDTGKGLAILPVEAKSINRLVFGPKGDTLAVSLSYAPFIQIWELPTK